MSWQALCTVQLLTPVVQIYAQYHSAMHNGRRGGGGGEKEWQTETGKINTNVVSSWVLMSTTQDHSLTQEYKWAEKKKEKK